MLADVGGAGSAQKIPSGPLAGRSRGCAQTKGRAWGLQPARSGRTTTIVCTRAHYAAFPAGVTPRLPRSRIVVHETTIRTRDSCARGAGRDTPVRRTGDLVAADHRTQTAESHPTAVTPAADGSSLLSRTVAPSRERRTEPRVLVARMVGDEVDDHAQPQGGGPLDERVGVGERPQQRVAVAGVRDVGAAVGPGGRAERREPDRVDAQPGQVVEPGGEAGQVPDAVTVGVRERLRVDLVDHPAARHHGPGPVRLSGDVRSAVVRTSGAWSGTFTRWSAGGGGPGLPTGAGGSRRPVRRRGAEDELGPAQRSASGRSTAWAPAGDVDQHEQRRGAERAGEGVHLLVVRHQHPEVAEGDGRLGVPQVDQPAVVREHRVRVVGLGGGVDLAVVGVDLDPRLAGGEAGVRASRPTGRACGRCRGSSRRARRASPPRCAHP